MGLNNTIFLVYRIKIDDAYSKHFQINANSPKSGTERSIKSSIWSLIVPQDGQDANPYTLSISSGDEVCETIYPVQTSNSGRK